MKQTFPRVTASERPVHDRLRPRPGHSYDTGGHSEPPGHRGVGQLGRGGRDRRPRPVGRRDRARPRTRQGCGHEMASALFALAFPLGVRNQCLRHPATGWRDERRDGTRSRRAGVPGAEDALVPQSGGAPVSRRTGTLSSVFHACLIRWAMTQVTPPGWYPDRGRQVTRPPPSAGGTDRRGRTGPASRTVRRVGSADGRRPAGSPVRRRPVSGRGTLARTAPWAHRGGRRGASWSSRESAARIRAHRGRRRQRQHGALRGPGRSGRPGGPFGGQGVPSGPGRIRWFGRIGGRGGSGAPTADARTRRARRAAERGRIRPRPVQRHQHPRAGRLERRDDRRRGDRPVQGRVQVPRRPVEDVQHRRGVLGFRRRAGAGGRHRGGGGEAGHRQERRGVLRRQLLRRDHLAPGAGLQGGDRGRSAGLHGPLEGDHEGRCGRLCRVPGLPVAGRHKAPGRRPFRHRRGANAPAPSVLDQITKGIKSASPGGSGQNA